MNSLTLETDQSTTVPPGLRPWTEWRSTNLASSLGESGHRARHQVSVVGARCLSAEVTTTG
jgi:hypothetical protein